MSRHRCPITSLAAHREAKEGEKIANAASGPSGGRGGHRTRRPGPEECLSHTHTRASAPVGFIPERSECLLIAKLAVMLIIIKEAFSEEALLRATFFQRRANKLTRSSREAALLQTGTLRSSARPPAPSSCHSGRGCLTNAACHSPSGGPSIKAHPGGSWEAGQRPAPPNKDTLTFASGFSATSVLKE